MGELQHLLKKQTRSTKMGEQRGGRAGPVFSGPRFWGETFSFLAAGPSQGSSPFPHTQTESDCSHHWFKLEGMGV